MELKIFTRDGRFLCTVVAEENWRPLDVKEGVRTLTGITVIEQRLYGPEGRELPEKEFLRKVFVEAVDKAQDVVDITLERRPRLQAQWLEKVQEHGLQLRLAPREVRTDRVVVMAAVEKNWRAFEFASEELKLDREVALAAALQNHKAVAHVPKRLWDDRSFVLEMVKKDWSYIKSADDDILNDREVMFTAVGQDWHALEFASEELRGDRDLVLLAIRQGGPEVMDRHYCTPEATEQAVEDREAVLIMVRQDWRNLEMAHEQYWSDRELAMIAVTQDWRALGLISEELRNDVDIIMTAVQHDFCTLQVALQEFPVNREVLVLMASRSWHILAYLPEEYLADVNIATAAVKQDWKALQYTAKSCRANPKVVLEAVKQCVDVLEMDMVEEEARGDKDCVITAVSKRGSLLKVASDAMKDNQEVVLAAIQQDWHALEYASEGVRSVHSVVFVAAEQDVTALRWGSNKLRSDRSSMLDFVRWNQQCIKYVNADLLMDVLFVGALTKSVKVSKELYMDMVRHNWRSLKLMDKTVTRDREIVAEACKQDWQALDLALTVNAEVGLKLPAEDEDSDDELPNFLADPMVMLPAVKGNWEVLLRAEENIWEEMPIVLEAVLQEHTVLESVPKSCRKLVWANKEIALAAVSQDPMYVNHMDKALWLHVPIVMEAIKDDWQIILECPSKEQKKLWLDKEVAYFCVTQDWKALQHVNPDLWEDMELVLLGVKQSYKSLEFCPAPLTRAIWAVPDIVVEVMKQNPKAVQRIERNLQEDRDIFLTAARKDWEVVKLVCKDAQKKWYADPEFAMIGIEKDPQNLLQMDKKLLEDPEVVAAAVELNPELLEHAAESVRADKEVVLMAVELDGLTIRFASEELRGDREVAEVAVRQNGAALDHCSEALQADGDLVDLADLS